MLFFHYFCRLNKAFPRKTETMNMLIDILTDKELKGVARRQAVIDMLLQGNVPLTMLQELLPQLDEKKSATVLEALEEISNKKLMTLEQGHLQLAIPYIASSNNSCRREASRIVGNLAAAFPDAVKEALPSLMANTTDEGTVVRWSAAYALSRIIVLPDYAKSGLYDELLQLAETEQDNGVKSQYEKALKKAEKTRKR